MKIVFLSNYFTHHQKPLSDALAKKTCYTFISTKEMTEERRRMGWQMEKEPPYVCHYSEEKERAEHCLEQADIVITGSAPEALVRRCIDRGQVVFRYSERPLKNGSQWLKYLPRLLKWHWQNPFGKPIYMLCASAYTAADYARFGLFRNKCYRWGYFPEMACVPEAEKSAKKKLSASILWTGRFLVLKHPDDVIRVAARLKKDGYDFQLSLIGSGEMENRLREMVACEGLGDCVHLLGTMKPEEVRAQMEQSEIFLFTSDRKEGWGAVVNEAMSSGCAVIASHAAGSVPFLIRNGENGLVYQSGDVDGLYEKLRSLLDDPANAERLGTAACETIKSQWNAEVAADRFLQLAECVRAGGQMNTMFAEGPCSPAPVIKEYWFQG